MIDEWDLQRLEEQGKLTAAQRRYYREQLAVSQWGQLYRSDRDYDLRDRNKDRYKTHTQNTYYAKAV